MGEPEPQGSAKAFTFPVKDRFGRIVMNPKTGWPKFRAVITHDNPKVKTWREAIARAAERALGGVSLELVGAYAVDLKFFVVPPRKIPKSRCGLPSVRDDLDKLARACLDALTGVILADDSQVVDLHATKRYADAPSQARIEVTVTPIAIGLPLLADERILGNGITSTRAHSRPRASTAVPW